MNDALETLVVDFQLRCYREAMAGVRAYTQEVKEAKRLLSTLNFQIPSMPKLPVIAPMANRVMPTIEPLPVAKAAAQRLPVGREIGSVRIAALSPTAVGQLAATMRGRETVRTSTSTTTSIGGGFNPLRSLTVASAAATASLLGFTRAGLSGTVEGYRLESQFTLLSRNIASIFLPVIDQFTMRLQRLNFMLMRMDGGQQRKLMGAGLGVAGAGIAGGALAALAPVLGPVLGIFTGMIPVLGKLAIAGGPVTMALGLVGAAMAVAAGALVYLAATSKPVRDALRQVWESLTKVWEMSKELRVALYDIVESMVVNYFQSLSQAIKDIADALPGFIDDIKKLRNEIKGQFQWAKDFVAPVVQPIAEGIGRNILGPAADAFMAIQRQLELPMNGIVNVVQKLAPVNPFNPKGADAKAGPEDKKQVTPFQPGREDAMGAFNRFQDAMLKLGEEDVPKAQLAQLVAIGLNIDNLRAAILAGNAAAQFAARPAPNGRPRNGG